MNSSRIAALAACCVCLTASLYAGAAEHRASETAARTAASQATQGTWEARASRLIGAEVSNSEGEQLGNIEDLIIDVNNGRVHYAVLSFGRLVTMGNKLFAYPIAMFHPTERDNRLILEVAQERLQEAPGFSNSIWPDWNRKNQYSAEVNRYFGDKVAIEAVSNQHLVRATRLLDRDLRASDGKEIGEIEDFVIDMKNNRVRFAAIDFDDGWAAEDKLVLVPVRAIRIAGDRNRPSLNMDRNTIRQAPAFDEDRWPNLQDANTLANVDAYWASHATTGAAPATDAQR